MTEPMPDWAREMVTLYESEAHSQFILHGNVQDLFPLSGIGGRRLGSLREFLRTELLTNHEVVLGYDLGSGIRVEKGKDPFTGWSAYQENPQLQRPPRQSIEFLSHYFRYCANLGRLGKKRTHIACILDAAHLVVPAEGGMASHELNALALQIRDWATEPLLLEHPLVTVLLADSLNDLHPILANNPRAAQIRIPLPSEQDLEHALAGSVKEYPIALSGFPVLSGPAHQLKGASLSSVESLLKTFEYRKQPLRDQDLGEQKKRLLERDCRGLIEFIESRRSLADLHGLEPVKAWLRQDLELWRKNEIEALPKGYLICGPVGTGKTFLVECLAGEAGIPVVKLRNFRDRWVGSTEGNLETIFRLIQALGRCYVFVDEADQALGRRESGQGDSGLSGRVYAMIAEEMGSSRSRGRVIWILASSRPDLIEVDLKRPGRVDVKIPLFPAATSEEGTRLLRSLLARRGLDVSADELRALADRLPQFLTPGAAEALAVKVYRTVKTSTSTVSAALQACLTDYRNPVPADVLRFQIEIAARESTDASFVPDAFRSS
jgi:hypothetical protein